MQINSQEAMKNVDKELILEDKIMHPVIVTQIKN